MRRYGYGEAYKNKVEYSKVKYTIDIPGGEWYTMCKR